MTKALLLVSILCATAGAAPNDPVIAALKKAAHIYDILAINNRDRAHSAADGGGKLGIEAAQQCSDAVKHAYDTGATPSTVLLVDGYKKVLLGEVDAKYCKPLAELARTFDADLVTARHAEHDTVGAPYKAAGIAGDKLRFAIESDGFDRWAPGKRTLTTPAAIAHASVIYELIGGDDTGWTLERFQFSGNKLVSKTAEGFVVRPGASKFR